MYIVMDIEEVDLHAKVVQIQVMLSSQASQTLLRLVQIRET